MAKYSLANQAGAAFRAALNVILGDLHSHKYGSTDPATADSTPGMLWVDTGGANPVLKIRNAADSAWITIGTVTATDFELIGSTSFGRSLIDDANAAAARTTLASIIGTDVQAFDGLLKDIASDITFAQGDLIYANSSSQLLKLAKGTNGQFLQIGASVPVWADAQGGWTQIASDEPTSDVASIVFTGLSGQGYRALRGSGFLELVSATALEISIRAAAGTWRKIGQTIATTSTADTLGFNFQIDNFDGAAATDLIICTGISEYSVAGMDRSSNSRDDQSGGAGGITVGYTSWSETFDEIRIAPSTGNIEGSTADARGFFALEAISS